MNRLFALLIISLLIFSLGVSGCQKDNNQGIQNETNISNLNIASGESGSGSSAAAGPALLSADDACNIAKELVKVDAINCTAEKKDDTWTALYEYSCESYCAGLVIIDAKNSQVVYHMKY
jgi:hypothetical protein